jgi:HK97 family phage portal protein
VNHSTVRDTERWDASVGRWVPLPPVSRSISRVAAPTPIRKAVQSLSGVDDRGWFRVFESYPGAWQQNVTLDRDAILQNPTVYACVTLIASDMGKLALMLREMDADEIWNAVSIPAFSPVLRKPNHFQTRQQFVESWLISKLIHGNTYVLKQRDMRGVVTALYVLDPSRCKPLVAPNGDVFYELNSDDLSRLPFDIIAAPAAEIIHDRMECLFHPLVGISPLYAAALAATQGLKIAQNSAKFFENMARPSGILTAPAQISDEVANRLKEHWESNYRQDNIGKVAVLGDGLSYAPMAVNAVDSQQVEQSEEAAKQICSAFHVPAYMVGVGTAPPYNNTETLNQHYYDKCLHKLIDAFEACMDEGLGLPYVTGKSLRVEFDLDDLLRMDQTTKIKALSEAVKVGGMSPNEMRKKMNLSPVKGGDQPYLQEQNWPLQVLANRPPPADKPADPAPTAPPMSDDGTKALAMVERMGREAEFMRAIRSRFDREVVNG